MRSWHKIASISVSAQVECECGLKITIGGRGLQKCPKCGLGYYLSVAIQQYETYESGTDNTAKTGWECD